MTEVTIDSRGFNSLPTKGAAVTAQEIAGYKIGLVNNLTCVPQWRDVESVCRAIEFAEKAGLAVVKPGDRWNAARRFIEDIIRTGVDAGVAFYAAASAHELDHQAHAAF